MKFRFCGELDCPDWILAEIATLSKLTSVKMKLFCVEIMNYLLSGTLNYEKILKLTKDAKYEVGDLKGSIAAFDFIFSNAAKYFVESETLSNELQQLGLPKELAKSVHKVYDDKLESLRLVLEQNSMRISKLNSVDWRVDYVLGSNIKTESLRAEVQLVLDQSLPGNSNEIISFNVSSDKFKVLHKEMKDAYKYMDELSA